jgi:hypothetical protein
MTMHPTLWDFTRSPCAQPWARPTLQISFVTVLHKRIMWNSSQLPVRRKPSLRFCSVSDRNHTPLSGALSQVCKLENVSRNYNHQQGKDAKKSPLLTAYSARGQLMYHEVFIYVEDNIGSTWCLMFQHKIFVNEISAPLRGLIM